MAPRRSRRWRVAQRERCVVDRLAEDHANARRIAERLAESRFVELDPASVHTNIIVVGQAPDGADAPSLVDRSERRGVLLFVFGPRSIRFVGDFGTTTYSSNCRPTRRQAPGSAAAAR